MADTVTSSPANARALQEHDIFDFLAQTPLESPLDRTNRALFAAGTALTFLILFVSGVIVSLVAAGRSQSFMAAPASQPTATPTPSPVRVANPADITIEVLNGSGRAGVAAQTAQTLTEAGAHNVTIGNADAATYRETLLYVSADLDDVDEAWVMDLIQNALGVSTISGIPISSDADVQIIVGAGSG